MHCASFSNLKQRFPLTSKISHTLWPVRMAPQSLIQDFYQFNSTSLKVWLNVRFINVIIEAEINDSVEAEEIRLLKRLEKGASQRSPEIRGVCSRWHRFRGKGPLRGVPVCTGKQEAGGRRGEGQRKNRETETSLTMSVSGTGQEGANKWFYLKQ